MWPMAWCCQMGWPIVMRSRAYLMASSSARWATPTAPAATVGRLLSKTFIVVAKPEPSSLSRWEAGTRTSSNTTSAVSEACWPIFSNGLPTRMPSQSRWTTKKLMPV